MTESNSADVAEVASDEKEGAVKTYVSWAAKFNFETREMTSADWRAVGADLTDEEVSERKVTEWKQANGWRVPRSEIPLSDLQLGEFMGRNPGFTVIEG